MYALDERRILRLTTIPLLHYEDRARLHAEVAEGLPLRVPTMLEAGDVDGVTYTIEERIPGRSLDHVLAEVDGTDRRRALTAFADAALLVQRSTFARPWYGEVLQDRPIRSQAWDDYLIRRASANADRRGERLRESVPQLDDVLDRFREACATIGSVPRRLVHGDYFPGNVMVDDDFHVCAILDWSFLTISGDPRLDLAGAVIFLEVERT